MQLRTFATVLAMVGGLISLAPGSYAQNAPDPQAAAALTKFYASAPKPECVSGRIDISPTHYMIYTPDCGERGNLIGQQAVIAWLTEHLVSGKVGAILVGDYTYSDPVINAALIKAITDYHVPVLGAFDMSELYAGTKGDKKAEEANETEADLKKFTTHMLLNDLCRAGGDVVWGTSPVGGEFIMHLKEIILLDKDFQPLAEEDGSLNFTIPANMQSNVLHFFEDPTVAEASFRNWQFVHDAMVRAAKEFYPDGKTPGDQADIVKLRQEAACPALSTKRTFGDPIMGSATPHGRTGSPAEHRTHKPKD